MKYQIDTIPVWEALEFNSACILCTLQSKTEADEIERVLGASVMEPDVRVRTNEYGICCAHQQMMFQNQNRLGHALLMDTRAMEVLQKLGKIKQQAGSNTKKNKPFKSHAGQTSTADMLRKLNSHCVVCENIQTHMHRYTYTLLHLWKTDPKFKQQFSDAKGICIPHAADLLDAAGQQLRGKDCSEFTELCLHLLTENLAQDEKDLLWFTQKFDYRNQNKPWGNSKNAIERTINRLRGYCVGEPPYAKPKK